MGRFDLGLSETEFWRLTPRQFHFLHERLEQERERQDFRIGIVCSVFANIHRGKNRRPFKPQDFMPSGGKHKGHKRPTQTPDQMLSIVEMLNAAFGGADNRPGRPN